jgi:hypothetical protein
MQGEGKAEQAENGGWFGFIGCSSCVQGEFEATKAEGEGWLTD